MSAMTQLTRAPLAATGESCLVTEYKRQMTGHVWWKQIAFRIFLMIARFCDTKLGLPTIIHHDRHGRFWIDYCGTFDTRELALAAIAKMRESRNGEGKDGQFNWTDLPRNGVAPEKSSRYYDQDFPGTDTLAFKRANQKVECPYTHKLCNPEKVITETQLHDLLQAGNGTYDAAVRND